MMYFITTVQLKDGEVVDHRCVGYVDTFEEAEQIVTNNQCDIFEYCYNYAVIEAVPTGLYQYDLEPKWYEVRFEGDYACYEPIEKPDWVCSVGWGIG